MLKEVLKKKITTKDPIEKGILSIMCAELSKIKKETGKEIERIDIVSVAQTQIKQIEKGIEGVDPSSEFVQKSRKELAVLQGYVPQIDEGAVEVIVRSIVAENPQAKMGQVMGLVKKDHPDLDMKTVSKIVREKIFIHGG